MKVVEIFKYLNKLYAMCMACADSCGSRLLLSKIGPRGQVGYPHVLRGCASALFYDKERGNSYGQNGSEECHSVYAGICQATASIGKHRQDIY
jgi:hypothetical protein